MSEPAPQPYRLKMNLMIKNLLLTALGTCKFVMHHKTHYLSQAIEQFKLIETTHMDEFITTVKNTAPGRTLSLSIEDQILIYTVLDLTCKTYLTDLGDKLESVNAPAIKSTKSSFEAIRSTVLKGCEFVMEGMRDTLGGIDQFDDRVEILEQYVIV